jgi:hypothetical protein
MLLQEALLASFKDATARRAQQEEAMREWWQRRTASLTRERIMELLREDDGDAK